MQFSNGSPHSFNPNYQFDFQALFTQAWNMPSQVFFVLRLGILISFGGLFLLFSNLLETASNGATLEQLLRDNERFTETMNHVALWMLGVEMALAPLFAGLYMLGVCAARGESIRMVGLLAYLPYSLAILLSFVIITLLTQLGFALLILPGLYVFVACKFTFPLIIDRGLSPIQAIKVSILCVSRYWVQFTVLYLIFVLLMLLSVMTFFIGFIWVAPMYYQVKGILYRDLFDTDQPLQIVNNETDVSFDA